MQAVRSGGAPALEIIGGRQVDIGVGVADVPAHGHAQMVQAVAVPARPGADGVAARFREAVIGGEVHGLAQRHGEGEGRAGARSEEHTSELQSLMRISYAVFCLKKKPELSTHQHASTSSQHNTTLYLTRHITS